MNTDTQSASTLLEVITTQIGVEEIRSSSRISTHPLVLWAVFFVLLDIIVLQGYKYLQGYMPTFVKNPAWLIQPLFVLLAAVAVVYLHNRYDQAMEHIDIKKRTSDPKQFKTFLPLRFRGVLYVLGIGYGIGSVFTWTTIQKILQVGGVAELVGIFFVAPIGYMVVYAEFFATYVGIMILLPRKIKQTDFQLNHFDPENLGGLRPIGELMKACYYFIVLLLVGYLVFTYGPHLLGKILETGYSAPGVLTNILFTAGWLVTIATMAYGLSQLHWFMKREKRKELTALDKQGRELINQPFDMQQFEVTDEKEFDRIRQRAEYVNSTKEYPTTFTMWSQILITLILPKAVQMALVAV